MTDLPAPPVPADCDLRTFPYLPLDVVRLRDSRLSATATGDEFRAAVLLWCASWHQVPAASLPDDDRELAALAGYGREVKGWTKVRAMALYGWERHADGRLYHPVVTEKATEAWRQRQMQREKAARRWGNAAALGAGTPTADAAASPAASPTASPTASATAMQQNRTEQNRIERERVESSTPPPPIDQKEKNRFALAKALRRLGLSTAPTAVEEWADLLTGRAGCQNLDESLEGLGYLVAKALSEGVEVAYAKDAARFADRWAEKLSQRRSELEKLKKDSHVA